MPPCTIPTFVHSSSDVNKYLDLTDTSGEKDVAASEIESVVVDTSGERDIAVVDTSGSDVTFVGASESVVEN